MISQTQSEVDNGNNENIAGLYTRDGDHLGRQSYERTTPPALYLYWEVLASGEEGWVIADRHHGIDSNWPFHGGFHLAIGSDSATPLDFTDLLWAIYAVNGQQGMNYNFDTITLTCVVE
eukprot:TRINITY_DN14881_c0_g1_i1.p1 TRINITY_DN14881_c0_g1~~TRINITY_DN14881_c0_g1_i1.p1  ORF type:complete len:119 (-),score=19.80 TRINITY_DN14881_c0_g1_i1:158-514(-)